MVNPVSFNVTNAEGSLLYPVCGFPGFSLSPAYSESGGLVGTTICPCCLWEPGFDDCQAASSQAKSSILASVLAYRKKWAGTKQWQGQRNLIPEGFDGSKQVAELLKLARDLQ